ncbi:MAG: transposase family protein [Alteromonadaceae bacterium]|nr:transposase family protein [Alteromonadaceae bacterium]
MMNRTTISEAFKDLTGPRINRTKLHPLINILTISICAIIASCDRFSIYL